MNSQLLIVLPSRYGHLRLAEVIDAEGRAQLRRRLDDALAAGCVRLAVDAADVRHIEQGAVSDLLGVGARLRGRGGVLVVRASSWAFARVAERMGGTDLLVPDDSATADPAADDGRRAAEPVDLRDRRAGHGSDPRRPRTGRHRRLGSAPVLVAVGRRQD